MPVLLDQFVRQIVASGLMTAGEIDATLEEIQADRRPGDGEHLARELVRRKKLTAHQAKEIYSGRGKSLVLGNYVILDKLGQGGMGLVLKAEHRRMKRLVALKVLSPKVVRNPDSLRRFQREVEAAARLTHPNIVTAFDADEAGGTHFLVMEYVEGNDLSALVKQHGPLPRDQALNCILQAAAGLQYAHERGVVHRDIKPANLLLDHQGTVKILDMGLARLDTPGEDQDELTGTGQIMGTVDYMAPEQAASTKHADGRADIYSLGATLWYLLTRRSMYTGDTPVEKLIAHQTQPIPALRSVCPETPPALDEAFQRMVAKTPEARYQTMADVIASLDPFRSGTAAAGRPAVVEDVKLDAFLRGLGTAAASHPPRSSTTGPSPTETRQPPGRASEAAKPALGAAFEATLDWTGQHADTSPRTEQASPAGPVPPPPARKHPHQPQPLWWQDWRKLTVAGSSLVLLLLIALLIALRGGSQPRPTAASPDEPAAESGSLAPTPAATEETVTSARGYLVLRWPQPERANSRLEIDGRVYDPAQWAVPGNPDQLRLPLDPGEHRVCILRRGFEPFEETFQITAAAERIVQPAWNQALAQVEPPPIPTSSIHRSEGTPKPDIEQPPATTIGDWIPLFDGRTLNGWQADRNPHVWTVENGVLVGRGGPAETSHLLHEARFQDFEFEARVKINAAGNSGVYFRCVGTKPVDPPHPDGYEVQIIGSEIKAAERTGSLHGLAAVSQEHIQDDTWFTLRIAAIGAQVTVSIDGRTVLEHRLSPPRAGRIALQHWRAATEVHFKNIRVKILDAPTTAAHQPDAPRQAEQAPEPVVAKPPETDAGGGPAQPALAVRLAVLDRLLAEREPREAKYTRAMEPVDALVAAWNFAAAATALEQIRFDEQELAARLARRRDEVARFAALKARMIQRIRAAEPPLTKRDLGLRGLGGDVVGVDDTGISTRLVSGKEETLAWHELGPQATEKLLSLVTGDDQEVWLSAALFAHALGDGSLGRRLLKEAQTRGASLTAHVASVVAAELDGAVQLVRAGQYGPAMAALESLQATAAGLDWYAAHREVIETVEAVATAGLRGQEAEKLYKQAAGHFAKQALFDVRPLVDKLRAEYADTAAVLDSGKKPSFAELEQAVAGLGKMLTVRQDGKGDFTTIQAAIDAAPPNSLIEIQDNGPYREQIGITKDGITLRGKQGHWPVITSAGMPMAVSILARVSAPHVQIEQVVIVHSHSGGVHSRVLQVLSGPCKVVRAVIFGTDNTSLDVVGFTKLDCVVMTVMANIQEARLHAADSFWLAGTPMYLSKGGLFENTLLPGLRDVRHQTEFRRCLIRGELRLPEGSIVSDSIVPSIQASKPGVLIEFCNIHSRTPFVDQAKPGKGCFSAPPMFANPKNFDYRLVPGSPGTGKASDGGDVGVRYTPEMIEMLKLALELRARGVIKF